MFSEISSLAEVEVASEKYLGHNHLKILNQTVPQINADALVEAIHDANNHIEELVNKYSIQRLENGDLFMRKLNMLIQVKDVEKDIVLLNELQTKLAALRIKAQHELEQFSEPLQKLQEVFQNKDYIDHVLPNQAEYNRLFPKIIGVIQVAELKKNTITNAIQHAKDTEVELVGFADTTMFQIKENINHFGSKELLEDDVVSGMAKRLSTTLAGLKASSLAFNGGVALGGIALFFGLFGLPIPENSLNGRASFSFTIFIFGVSFIVATLYMIVQELRSQNKFGEKYLKTLLTTLSCSVGFTGVSGILIKMDSSLYTFYQLLPMYMIVLVAVSIIAGTAGFIYSRSFKGKYTYLKDAQRRISA